MPLFTRRRLQSMLNEISPLVTKEKARDLLGRLEAKRIEQVLPAEMELGLLWALSGIGKIDIEPQWWADGFRPDAYTEALVPGEPAVVEIAAHNDNEISGERAMDRVAQKMSAFANSVHRGLGTYLFFSFREESGYKDGRYFRRRLTPPDYELSNQAKDQIRVWIESGAADATRLRIVESGLDVNPGLDVEIEKKGTKQIQYHNTWSKMPPQTYSVDKNPLFELLKRKLDQLRVAPPGTRRFIFLGDAGSSLLNRIGRADEIDRNRRCVSGREILSHLVHTYQHRIDSVVVFAPGRESTLSLRDELR